MALVLMGGNVLTMDARNSRAEALAVEGGKIAAFGTNAEVSELVGENTKVVHLAGRTPSVAPGSPLVAGGYFLWITMVLPPMAVLSSASQRSTDCVTPVL